MTNDGSVGEAVGNGDMIMVLLSKAPEKPWNQVMLKEVLKLSDDEFDKAVHELSKWVKLEPTNNSIVAGDCSGSGAGNGYWAGDSDRFEAAQKVVEDRTGDAIGNR